jgi:hypothetical protein
MPDVPITPETDHVVIGGRRVARGSRVVLRPGRRRADAQDVFLVGKVATVQAVYLDVSGEPSLAVTVDDDPVVEAQLLQARYRYFAPDEVEAAEGQASA